MKRLFALVLIASLWFNFAPPAAADGGVAGLTPCSESPAFQQKSKNFRNTTGDPDSGRKRAERYAQALCGPEGYPHLIVDGRLERAGDFIIPGLLFLYIAGWIGWVGRKYLRAVSTTKNPTENEIIINVPLALKIMTTGYIWPISAWQELISGELIASEENVTVSPR